MRARNIKPGFFDNETLAALKPLTRILFEGLWCFADRAGRFEWRPQKIKVKILPYDNGDITVMLRELVDAGFVVQYSVNGIQYGQVINFLKHQRPHHTEKASEIPPLSLNGDITVNSPLEDGENPPDSLIPDSLIPDSLIQEEEASSHSEKPKLIFKCDFFLIDQKYHEKLKVEFKGMSEKQLRTEFSKMEDYLTDNHKKYKRHSKGQLKNPKNFIRNWLERVEIQPRAPTHTKRKYGYNSKDADKAIEEALK